MIAYTETHSHPFVSAVKPFSQRLQSFIAVAVMILIPALCIVANQAGLLRIVLPVLSLMVAGFLLWMSKPLYVGLVFWLWFLTPFLGRMADYQGGWTPRDAVLLTPYLAGGLSVIAILQSFRKLGNRKMLPYLCALIAILYGLILGVISLPLFDVVRALLNWIVPVLFGIFIYVNRDYYPEFRRAIEKSFVAALLLMGAYGIYQFFFLPDWDRLWMLNVQLNSFGSVHAMKIRVFSTMNAPEIYAAVTTCGLLLLFNLRGKLRLIAAAFSFIALMLTVSRAAWLSLAVGAFYLMIRAGARQRARMVLAVAACGIFAVIGITQLPVVENLVWQRLQTFSDPSQDVSFSARVEGYKRDFQQIAQQPFGEGLGSMDAKHNTEGDDDIIGPHDSTVLETLYSLGWIGSLVFTFGLGSLCMQLFSTANHDAFIVSSKAILISFVAQVLLNSVMIGVLGFMVWTFAAMILAESDHASELEELARQEEGDPFVYTAA